jgi:hypothetical protein
MASSKARWWITTHTSPDGRRNCYHTYMRANLRLVLGVDVHPGDEHTPKHGRAGLWSPLHRIGRRRWGLNPRPQPPDSLIREHDIFSFDLGQRRFHQVEGELLVVSAAASDVWGISASHNVFWSDLQRGRSADTGPAR